MGRRQLIYNTYERVLFTTVTINEPIILHLFKRYDLSQCILSVFSLPFRGCIEIYLAKCAKAT